MPKGHFKHDTEQLKRWYYDEQKSATEIADLLGVTSGAVYDMMRRRNMKRRSNSQAQRLYNGYEKLTDKAMLQNLYIDQEMTTDEIANVIGCNSESVRKALIHFKISRRSHGMRVEPRLKHFRNQQWLYREYITNNKSQAQIAEENDCAESLVCKWVKRHQIHKHSRWSDNDYNESHTARNNQDYSRWRKAVLEAFKHTCYVCGKKQHLQAHHIVTFAHNVELRYIEKNGVCLCKMCHKAVHRSSYNSSQQKQKLGETEKTRLGQLRTKLLREHVE